MLFVWGRNDSGELGLSHECYVDSPTMLDQNLFDSRVIDLAAGFCHSVAVTENGNVYTWGKNDNYQLGYDTKKQSRNKPVSLSLNLMVLSVSCGSDFTMVVTREGKVYSWGIGSSGQLGHGNKRGYVTPKLIENLENIKRVECGYCHALFLQINGSLFTCGSNERGSTGVGSDEGYHLSPIRLELNDVKEIFVYEGSSLALSENGTLYRWGEFGTLIDTTPKMIVFNEEIVQFSCNSKNILFLTASNKLFVCVEKIIAEISKLEIFSSLNLNTSTEFNQNLLKIDKVFCGSELNFCTVLNNSNFYTVSWKSYLNDSSKYKKNI